MTPDEVAAVADEHARAAETELIRYEFTESEKSKGSHNWSSNAHGEVYYRDGSLHYLSMTLGWGTVGSLKVPPQEIQGEQLERINQRLANNPDEQQTLYLPISVTDASYENRIAGRETIDGHECVILDSLPRPTADPRPHYHVRTWVAIDTLDVLQFTREFTKGLDSNRYTLRYGYLKRVPLPAQSISDWDSSMPPPSKGRIHLHNVITFTNYRLFTVTTKIIEGAPAGDKPGEKPEEVPPNHLPAVPSDPQKP